MLVLISFSSLFVAGDAVLPQIIMEETSLLLVRLAKLVLHPLTATRMNLPVSAREVGAEKNECEQELRTSSSSIYRLSSERAHLFLLYKNFCELLTSRYGCPSSLLNCFTYPKTERLIQFLEKFII